MSTQGNPPGEQGSGDHRSSPRIAVKDKGKGKANVPWKERKKRLRLPNDRNPSSQTADAGRSDDAGGGDDVDSANEANEKKCRIQPPAMWCSPAKWLDIVKALSKGVIDDVKAKVSVAYCCSNHPAWIRNF
jgi:hypothetical protein